MSLLDDLKRQAEAKKEEEEALHLRQEHAAETFRAEVHPRLAQAATYLSELTEHLNFVQPDIRADYPIKGYGLLEGLRQSNYQVITDGDEALRAVALSFTCTGTRPLSFDVQGQALMTRETEFLRENRLEFSRREHRGERRNITGATFKVEPRVPVTIRFDLTEDLLQVVLTVSNLDALETRRYPLAYQKLDRAFLDELGKAVLRQQNTFLRLDISAEDRKRLHAQIDQLGNQHAPTSRTHAKDTRGQAAATPPPAGPVPSESTLAHPSKSSVVAVDSTQPEPEPQARAPAAKGAPNIAVGFTRAPLPVGASSYAESTGALIEVDEQLKRIGGLQRTPMQLLDAVGWMLAALNRSALPQPGRRLRYAETILQHAHGALAHFHGEFLRTPGGLPEDEYRREALSRCVNVSAQLVTSYGQALQEDYPANPADYAQVRARVVQCAFRILELSRVEQRLRALRYQRMPADAWRDCNRAYFLLAAHDETDQSLPLGCDVGLRRRAGGVRHGRVLATPRELFLSVQLFGFLDLTMWPVQLFRLPDAYLDEVRAKVRVLDDDRQALPPGRLLATLNDSGPAVGIRPPNVTPPAVTLDYSELFTLALRDRMELDKMNFIAHFDRARVSQTIAEFGELDRLAGLDLLLHSLTRRERTQQRRAVLDDQRLHVHFGFNECYRALKQAGKHDGGAPVSGKRDPGHPASEWNLINFSTGGLLVGTNETDIPRPARVGDPVVFAPVGNAHLPLIGYVARLQHPGEFEAQVAIVRLSRYAEASAVQANEADRLFEQPAILVQDVKSQWRLVVPPEYGFVSGTPLKLIRADGFLVPARLGELRLMHPEFAVFDVRSPGLETTPVDTEAPKSRS